MPIFIILRGLQGATQDETQVGQRKTRFAHNIQNSALYYEKGQNGGQKDLAIPNVNVPLYRE